MTIIYTNCGQKERGPTDKR